MRPIEKLPESMELARSLGFDPVGAPMIEMKRISGNEFRNFLIALSNRSVYLCIMMTENVIRFALENANAYIPHDRFIDQLRHCTVIAIGEKTASSLRDIGLEPDDTPSVLTIKGLASHIDSAYDIGGRRVEILMSDKGLSALEKRLVEMGGDVHVLPLYSIDMPDDLTEPKKLIQSSIRREIDIFAFTSSLTVAHFLAVADELGVREKVVDILNDKIVAAINDTTRKSLESEGVSVMLTARSATFEEMLSTIGLGLGIAPAEP